MAEAEVKTSDLVVSAVGLVKEFRDFWNRPKAKAVNDLDFEVREGEVLGLLGPNGSGKSTTVKMLLGLLYPTAGRLTVFGKSPRDVDTKRLIGYLPEESYLYKYLTAYETLDFFGSLFNLSPLERRKRSEQLLEMVGLSHAKHRPVGEFSKGMTRRIGLAQAMINDPALLILDEPTSGLDPLGCREVKDLILALKKRGKTVLVTSHLLSDVEDVCDRVIILYGGKIRAEGELSQLLTVSDSNRIVAPSLPEPAMEEIREILRRNLKDGEFVMDHPRRSLEEFFLNVISAAKRDSVETAGVVGGGKIADYLEKGDETSAVLADLIAEPQAEPAAAPAKPAPAETKAPDVSEKLEALTSGVPAPPEVPDAAVKPKEDLSAANARLDDLLGKK